MNWPPVPRDSKARSNLPPMLLVLDCIVPIKGELNLRTLLKTSFLLLLIAGCASLSGPTPSEQALAVLTAYHADQKGSDVDAIMAHYSEDFTNIQGVSKSQVRQYISGMVAQNAFASVTSDLTQAVATVEGEVVTITPVTYNSQVGASDFTYKLQQEADSIWRIVSSVQAQ